MGLKQLLIAFDQMLNALIGGMADETLSARAYRIEDKAVAWAWARQYIDTLFFWQPSHCESAYMAERKRKQLPGEYRTA